MRGRLIVAAAAAALLLVPAFGAAASPASSACWGQASRVFAEMGVMGEHASSFESPRVGLRNLARSLAADGTIEDDSMQALGAFVADELRLSIDACA